MNYGIQYLCHLVQTKNDLNRKRRRFYNLINPGHKSYKLAADDRTRLKKLKQAEKKGIAEWSHTYDWLRVPNSIPCAYTKAYVQSAYKKAQREMKAMTPEMRRVRKVIGARFRWGDSGNIQSVECGEQTFYPKDIARLAELYKADAILLGD